LRRVIISHSMWVVQLSGDSERRRQEGWKMEGPQA
jgi:hypothetical protein